MSRIRPASQRGAAVAGHGQRGQPSVPDESALAKHRAGRESYVSGAVHIVQDNRQMRDSLESLVESNGMWPQPFESATRFLTDYRPVNPQCLLVDVQLPDLTGLELQRRLQVLDITMPIIFISAHASVPIAVQAMTQGAFDFFECPLEGDRLLERIRAALAANGCSQRLHAEQLDVKRRFDSLTARELEVSRLVARGMSSKQVAAALRIATKTVETHRLNIMRKLGVRNVVELIRLSHANSLGFRSSRLTDEPMMG